MENRLWMIKLGGSLITNKEKPYTVRYNVLRRLAKEIAMLHKEGYKLLLGHGGGSFPHISARKYRTVDGIIDERSRIGMSIVHRDAERLNMIVLRYLLYEDVPAYPIQTSAISTTNNDKIVKIFTYPIIHLLRNGLIPVVYGDVGIDTSKGCTIISTEAIFEALARELSKEYTVKIVMCEAVDGVYDKDPYRYPDAKLIPLINEKNIEPVLKMVGGSAWIDVTGGMKHKIETLYGLAKSGISSVIVNGRVRGRLIKAVKGLPVISTRIEI